MISDINLNGVYKRFQSIFSEEKWFRPINIDRITQPHAILTVQNRKMCDVTL